MYHTLVFHTIGLGKRVQKALALTPYPNALGVTQASTILLISQHQTISQSKIAHHLHLEPASVVTLIDELERLKLVTRKPAENDRRKYQISLTQNGELIVPAIESNTDKLDKYLRKNLNATETKSFLKATEKLIGYLDQWQQNQGKGGENELSSPKQLMENGKSDTSIKNSNSGKSDTSIKNSNTTYKERPARSI